MARRACGTRASAPTAAMRATTSSILVPDGEREWTVWLRGYRAVGQERGLRFKPLYEVTDEPYTVYFPIQARS